MLYLLFISVLEGSTVAFGWLLLSEGELQAFLTYIIIGHITSLRGLSGNVFYFTFINLVFHLRTCITPYCTSLGDCDTRKIIIRVWFLSKIIYISKP